MNLILKKYITPRWDAAALKVSIGFWVTHAMNQRSYLSYPL